MTCGYLCPQCEGRGYLESGDSCEWCNVQYTPSITITDEEWLKSTHEGTCCSDTSNDKPQLNQ